MFYQIFSLHEISNKRYDFPFLVGKHMIAILNLIHLRSAVLRFKYRDRIFDWDNGVFALVLIPNNSQNRNVNVSKIDKITTLPKGQRECISRVISETVKVGLGANWQLS